MGWTIGVNLSTGKYVASEVERSPFTEFEAWQLLREKVVCELNQFTQEANAQYQSFKDQLTQIENEQIRLRRPSKENATP